MIENNDNNSTESNCPRYLPPFKSVKKESKIRLGELPSSSQKRPPMPSGPRDALLSFSAKGRLGRLSFPAAGFYSVFVILFIVGNIVWVGTHLFSGLTDRIVRASSEPWGVGIFLGLFIFTIVFYILYFTVTQSIRRLHDLNLSGWWILLFFVPSLISRVLGLHLFSNTVVGVSELFLVFLMLAPGTKGANRFGAPRWTSSSEKWIGMSSIVGVVLMLAPIEYRLYFPDAPHPTDTALATPSTIISSSTSTNYDEPYPFTAQEFWAKLLKLTALPDDTLSKAGVENALGMTLQPDKNMTEMFNHPYFTTKSGVDWYFSSSFESDLFGLKGALFSFGWTNSIGSTPPTGMCINANDVKPSLISQGWVEEAGNGSTLGVLRTDYLKGKDQEVNLSIYSDTDSKCVTGFKLMAPNKPSSTS